MQDLEAARAQARRIAEKNHDVFWDGFARDTAGWALESADQEFLARITSRKISGRALLSNKHVQIRAQAALIEAAMAAACEHPKRQWLWITIASDHGITFEREPYLDYDSLVGIMEHHLRRCGLHGIGVIEADIWKNLTGELKGRRIVPHAHFLGYMADGKRLGVKTFEAELCARRSLKNSVGARSVDVKNVKPYPGEFARRAGYMLKRPAFAKMLQPERGRLAPVGHSSGSIARLVELASHVEIGDVLFSIGSGGREIAKKVRQAVAEEVRERRGATSAPSCEEVIRHWRRIRLTNGNPRHREPTIITRRTNRSKGSNQGA